MHKYGTVLELKKNSAIIISDGFRYLYVKKRPGMYLGQKIMFFDEDIINPRSDIVKYSAIAACFVLIVLTIFLSRIKPFDTDRTFAYVYLDINPSVQITIDENNTVLDTSAVNSDADVLLESLDTKGMNLKDALKVIYEKSEKCGFFKDDTDNYVLISGSINPESRFYKKNENYEDTEFQKFLSSLKGASGEKGHKRIIIEAVKIPPETRALALKNQMSPGKYYLYTLAAEEGIDLSIDKVRNSSINDIMEALNHAPEASDNPPDSPDAQIQKPEEDVMFSEPDNNVKSDHQPGQSKQIEQNTQPEIGTREKKGQQPALETKPDGGTGSEAQQPAVNSHVLKAPASAEWDVGVMYSAGDVAEYGGEKYKCIQAHKSQADWTPEKVPALWQKQSGSAEKNSWQPGNAYREGDLVMYKEIKYRCLQAHTALEGWEPPVVPALWEKQQ